MLMKEHPVIMGEWLLGTTFINNNYYIFSHRYGKMSRVGYEVLSRVQSSGVSMGELLVGHRPYQHSSAVLNF